MAPLDLSTIFKQYEGKWVALSDDNKTVFGFGDTVKEAVENAKINGHPEFTLLFVEPSDTLYCGHS